MRNNNLLLRRWQFIKVISRYFLGRESSSTGLYGGHLFEEISNIGCFGKDALKMTYTGMLNLKLKKEATTTLKNFARA